MNASGTMNDVTTMVHESGHAVHSFLTHTLPLYIYQSYPIEMAELASMSMEFFTWPYWAHFLSDPTQLKRAQQQHVERVITIMPWIALIDEFQHWIYTNPTHTHMERREKWLCLYKEYTPSILHTDGLEEYIAYAWQKQIHLFEYPFYYIEYAIAQLGAIGMWKNYIENPSRTIEQYIQALSLGGKKDLKELYQTAGVSFDFTPQHMGQLFSFVEKQLTQCAMA
jgi:oligoendopeptidase F